MKVNYVAKKSVLCRTGFYVSILLCWLIIPILYLIYVVLSQKSYKAEFYDDKIIVTKGIISKSSNTIRMSGILSVSYDQTVWGRICGYGDVRINSVGKHADISLSGIKYPVELKKYLESTVQAKTTVKEFIGE